MAIISESGCGKTVLLKTLIGLNKPNTGRIFFDVTTEELNMSTDQRVLQFF
ncbi:MAG: ATP-binding cassette domain-containing protein [Planctomycetaceae bacterium]|nr:ATP-binding cassette domain-containing protein [Planctomycetaceae bacterium]